MFTKKQYQEAARYLASCIAHDSVTDETKILAENFCYQEALYTIINGTGEGEPIGIFSQEDIANATPAPQHASPQTPQNSRVEEECGG